MLKHPSRFDGEIKAWNTVLLGWDNLSGVGCFGLDSKIWPNWIRLRDGVEFTTPPSNHIYEQH